MQEGRKLSAKEIVADMRSGLTDDDLMKKYGLSRPKLDGIFQKLIGIGAVSQADLDTRKAPSGMKTQAAPTQAVPSPARKPAPPQPTQIRQEPPEPATPPPRAVPKQAPSVPLSEVREDLIGLARKVSIPRDYLERLVEKYQLPGELLETPEAPEAAPKPTGKPEKKSFFGSLFKKSPKPDKKAGKGKAADKASPVAEEAAVEPTEKPAEKPKRGLLSGLGGKKKEEARPAPSAASDADLTGEGEPGQGPLKRKVAAKSSKGFFARIFSSREKKPAAPKAAKTGTRRPVVEKGK
ncbi:MAG: hypothetical protein V2B18_10865 [Pseudomonadota bacterium]